MPFSESSISDPSYLLKLARTTMPFGKYKGLLLIDFLRGLGEMLRAVYEIKVNGLEYLFEPLKRVRSKSVPNGSGIAIDD
ncbi:DUF3820 family protein [Chitinispirillales bacterium ANBcel5]|uniref:putative quorum-sensing-regulated virulence factor n=1 Tax=Cellulosispirillum alkaliphilum TaxID=3039283 RepID=UPI002A55B641|nr:DUF3820 family protein [Chitinispirillales bacterium ANBcel5]